MTATETALRDRVQKLGAALRESREVLWNYCGDEPVREMLVRIQALLAQAAPERCLWEHQGANVYDTGCGSTYLGDGKTMPGPYCEKCGKPIELAGGEG